MSAFDGSNGPTLLVQFYFNGAFTNVATADLREVDLYRGRARADQRIEAGKLTVVFDNHSGAYDPDNLSGPWVISGVTALRDNLRARFIASYGGTGYILFDGYLENVTLDAGFDAIATMEFSDGLFLLGKATAPTLSSTQYNGETTAARVNRALSYAGWSGGSSWRSITGSVTLIGTTQNQNVLDMIDTCTQAEAGAFYVSRSGVATFLNLAHKFSRPTMLTLDDSQAANTVEYYAIDTTPGVLQIVNWANVTRGKLAHQNYQYTPSVTKYGVKKFEVEAPVLVDSVAKKLALYLSRKDAIPVTTVNSVSFTALGLGALYPDFLSMELMDMVIVKRTTVDGRNLKLPLVVEGLQYKITANDWDVTLMTSPVNQYRVTLP